MSDNAADPKAVQGKRDAAQLSQDKMLADVKELLKLNAGRRYFRELLRRGYIFSTTFTGNSRAMFLEGHRNFALSVLSDVQKARPEAMVELLTKHEEDYDA